MWDWDGDQPPKPSGPQLSRRHLVTGLVLLGAILGLGAIMAGLVLRSGYQPADPQRWTAAAPEPADGAGPAEEADVPDLAKILDGSALNVGNPAPLALRAGEALELRNRETEVKVTAGGAVLRTDGCSDVPLAIVPLTIAVEKGSAGFEPSAYRLRTAEGVDVESSEACTRPAASATTLNAGERVTVEMAFPATEPGWLVWGPDRGPPQAMWRLS